MRTVIDFVKEAHQRGRTREEVRCIALSTQWRGQVTEVLTSYDNQTTLSTACTRVQYAPAEEEQVNA